MNTSKKTNYEQSNIQKIHNYFYVIIYFLQINF